MHEPFDFHITPTQLVSAYRLVSSPVGVITRQEQRKYWGIALKAGGKTFYTQDNTQVPSDKDHIILLPKNSRYSWTCTEPGDCVIIDFDAPEEWQQITCIEVSDSGFLLSAFAKIEKALTLNTPASRLEAISQLYGVLAFLAKAANKKYTAKDKQKILAPAMDHILENYADPTLTNDALASLCGISTVYFRKLFETVYGISPIRYLHQLRIRKARAILSGDYDSIAQIAGSVGYSSVYHFSKMFKTYTGTSPTEYAKASR